MLHLKFALNLEHLADEMIDAVADAWNSPFEAPIVLLLTEAEECEIICCGRFEEPRCIEYFSHAFHVRPGIIVTRLQAQRKIPAISPLNAFKIAV